MKQIKIADPQKIRGLWLAARVAQSEDYNPENKESELTAWESGPLVTALKGMLEPFPTGRVSDNELARFFRDWYLGGCPRVLHELRPGHKLGYILEALEHELVFVEGVFLGKLIEVLEAGGGLGATSWSISLRPTSEAPNFPLDHHLVTCVMVDLTDMRIKQATSRGDKAGGGLEAKRQLMTHAQDCRARGHEVFVLAGWPGQHWHDVFIVDNLEEIAGGPDDGPAFDLGDLADDLSGVKLL